MRIQDYRRVQVEDIENDPERLLEPMNQQFDILTLAMQRRLSLEDNLNAETRTLEMTDQTAQDIRLQRLSGIPWGVQVVRADHNDYLPALKWEVIEKDLVRCTVKWTSDPGEPKDVTLIFWGS